MKYLLLLLLSGCAVPTRIAEAHQADYDKHELTPEQKWDKIYAEAIK